MEFDSDDAKLFASDDNFSIFSASTKKEPKKESKQTVCGDSTDRDDDEMDEIFGTADVSESDDEKDETDRDSKQSCTPVVVPSAVHAPVVVPSAVHAPNGETGPVLYQ
jgi:hypothetical protein